MSMSRAVLGSGTWSSGETCRRRVWAITWEQLWWCCPRAGSSRPPQQRSAAPVSSPGSSRWCPVPPCLPRSPGSCLSNGRGQRSEQGLGATLTLGVCVWETYPGQKWSCCPGGRLSAGKPALRCHILRYRRWWWAAATTNSLKFLKEALIQVQKLTDAELTPKWTKMPSILQMHEQKK